MSARTQVAQASWNDSDLARNWARRPADANTIILVEPDTRAARCLDREVRPLGMQLEMFEDPFRALLRAAADEADAVIASANLGRDVLLSLVEALRGELSIPVLLAHGPGDVAVLGPAVVAGARPAIHLPYRPRQLVEALRDALPDTLKSRVLEAGTLRLDPDCFDVQVAGVGLDLTVFEFELFHELALHLGSVVPSSRLGVRLWPEATMTGKPLATAVKRLRRKLELAGLPDAIHTVRGIGYRLERQPFAAA